MVFMELEICFMAWRCKVVAVWVGKGNPTLKERDDLHALQMEFIDVRT